MPQAICHQEMPQAVCQIEAKIGPVAHRLKLPVGACIHPVFHVLLLKKKIGSLQSVATTLPEPSMDYQCPLQPELVLRIKWCQLSEEKASWEDKDFIQAQFPQFKS